MKKIISYLLISISCLFLCGCSSYPDLTTEEQELVAEYAAGVLLKHSEASGNRLVDVEDTDVIEESEVLPEEKEEEIPEEPVVEPPKDDTPVIDNTEIITEECTYPINSALGVDVLSVQSNGYEIRDSYADESSAFFALDAAEGCKLLVMKYIVTNNTDSAVEMNMLSQDTSYKVALDGAKYKFALSTMLLDDLSTYVGTLAAGESVELVLISEWSEEEIQNITNLTLYLVNGDISGAYPVQ